jgi:hypothetical protein
VGEKNKSLAKRLAYIIYRAFTGLYLPADKLLQVIFHAFIGDSHIDYFKQLPSSATLPGPAKAQKRLALRSQLACHAPVQSIAGKSRLKIKLYWSQNHHQYESMNKRTFQ